MRFLNLSSNPELCGVRSKENVEVIMPSPFVDMTWSNTGKNLSTLILNRCFIEHDMVERLLAGLPALNELYLAHNNYTRVNFSPEFVHSNLRILYFNNNKVDDWHEIVKLGDHFDQLETLVLSENPIDGIKPRSSDSSTVASEATFRNLKQLTMNKLNLNEWDDLERIKKEFVTLKHLKIQNIPLLNDIKGDDERFTMLLAYFGDFIEMLNGSPVTQKERDAAERKFLRYFMDHSELQKPPRFTISHRYLYFIPSFYRKNESIFIINIGYT